MAPVLLKKFNLSMSCEQFLSQFWYDDNHHFYESFLRDKLQDVGISIVAWSSSSSEMKAMSRQRTVRSFHPSKISFPGLPSHAESIKKHEVDVVYEAVPSSSSTVPNTANNHLNQDHHHQTITKISIKETNSFRGIPYSDYFHVVTDWEVLDSSSRQQAVGQDECVVSVYLNFVFFKSTWLQGTIESNTKAELMEVMDQWYESALHHMRMMLDHRSTMQSLPSSQSMIAIQQQGTNAGVDDTMMDEDVEAGIQRDPSEGGSSSAPKTPTDRQSKSSSRASSDHEGSGMIFDDHDEDDEDDLEEEEEDELVFYDCEEGEGKALLVSNKLQNGSKRSLLSLDQASSAAGSSSYIRTRHGLNSTHSSSNTVGSPMAYKSRSYSNAKVGKHLVPPTPPDLRRYYGNNYLQSGKEYQLHHHNHHVKKEDYDSDHSTGVEDENVSYPQSSAREMAIQIVETVFVLAEFSFWQVYQFYMYDMKDLFNIDLTRVISRIINSFLPGWHVPLLNQPDIYGPLIAVFLLPQTLLLSTETSRHGCNPTSQLWNGIVVCFFIWFGLAFFYRLLAMLVAPSISFKHCLSVLGYSFYSWNIALLLSLPLEQYKDEIQIHYLLPLVIFGIPASIAQGYMFWEVTPVSTLTLQTSSLPISIQHIATYNSRWMQKLLWILPKLLVFLLVAGTHYQFLWYMARVFLPGRRQICRLTGIMQPSQYADILTQKEIRLFALKLLSGKDR